MADALNAQNSRRPRSSAAFLARLTQLWHTAGASLCLLFLCSCSTTHHSAATAPAGKLPAEVEMDRDAGRGNWIFVTLRLDSGEELPFFLDTGASGTCFDKSLEPMLGARQGTDTSWHFGHKGDAGVYLAPRLYLGGTPLEMTGPYVATIDLAADVESEVGRPIAGVLGMDVLEHYCIQLDFGARKIRFLDGEHADKSGWGKAFSLTNPGDIFPAVSANLAGGHIPGSLVDSGCNGDGWLGAALYDRWTNQASASASGQVRSPKGALDGEVYPEMELDRLDEGEVSSGDSHMKVNGIGLRFLSRHLVTFDFPNQTLYLKRISAGPLLLPVRQQKAVGKSIYWFVRGLKARDQLPGWSKAEKFPKTARFNCHTLSSGSLSLRKKGDPSLYHYWGTRASEHGPWRLKKAWRTDEGGQTVEEYPVP